MLLDNPFLIRELRQLERRPRGAYLTLLIFLGAMAVVLVSCISFLSTAQGGPMSRGAHAVLDFELWLLCMTHVLLCCTAAGYGGYRFFALEHARSTFEPLQSLPYSPLRWIWLKLAFPLLCTLVAWTAGLPFFILAALCTLIRLEDIPRLMQKPLLASAAILIIALLITPEMIGKHREMMARQQKGLKRANREYSIWNSLIIAIAYVTIMAVTVGQFASGHEHAWFSLWVSESWFWVIGIGCVVLAAATTGATALVFSERLRRIAWYLRLLAVTVIYVICLGFLWPDSSPSVRWGGLLFPLLMWLLTREKNSEADENARNEAYVQRIAALWDNPLLIHDLRVMGRRMPVTRYILWSLGFTTIAPTLLYLGYSYFPWAGFLHSIAWGCAWGLIQTIPSTWGGVRLRWQKEWTGQTLPQLLITPLTDREIVLGRIAAVPAFHWVGMLPYLPAFLIFLIWLAREGYWISGPLALALCPLLLSMGAWMSSNITKPRRLGPRLRRQDIPAFLLTGAQLLIFGGCLCLLIIQQSLGDNLTSMLLAWGFAAGLCTLNTWLCWAWILFRVRQVREFRSGDIDVPDSSILNSGTEKARRQRRPLFARSSESGT